MRTGRKVETFCIRAESGRDKSILKKKGQENYNMLRNDLKKSIPVPSYLVLKTSLLSTMREFGRSFLVVYEWTPLFRGLQRSVVAIISTQE